MLWFDTRLLGLLTVLGHSVLGATAPNILFIFADDLSHEAVGFAGNSEVSTPHLDRLAEDGVHYVNAYNMGSWTGAVCVASRTMFNTGRQLWRAQLGRQELEAMVQRGELWSQRMKSLGYRTYFSGKWHVKAPVTAVFDVVGQERPGMPMDYDPETRPEAYHRPRLGKADTWDPGDPALGGFWGGGTHWSEGVADDAEAFLEQAASENEPFFMYLAFNAAHDPRQSPREFLNLYPEEKTEVPDNFLPEYPYAEAIESGRSLRDEMLAPFPRTPYAIRVHRSEYYAIISHMDAQIGRILQALERTGKADNTYIFFTADHGLAVGHHGLMGKQNMYEHSLKAPLLIVGPDIPAGETRAARIYIQDLVETSLALAGTGNSGNTEFGNLLPTLRDPQAKGPHAVVYGAYKEAQRMIVENDYKLIVYPEVPLLRLFNLAADPDEVQDLAGQAAYQDLEQRLLSRLRAEQRQLEDPLALDPGLGGSKP